MSHTTTTEEPSPSICKNCREKPVSSSNHSSVRCPKMPQIQRSGHGMKTYANRIWMAVEQSKKIIERTWKHLDYKRNSFACCFDHDDNGKLTAKGVRDVKTFLNLLDQEETLTYEKNFGFLKLTNPFRGLHSTLLGGGPCSFQVLAPFEPFSDEHLSEMCELYLMNEVENVPFIEYDDVILAPVLELLTPITNGLAYISKECDEVWSYKNVFRCLKNTYSEPYLSQFWFYNNADFSCRKFKLPSDPGTDKKYLNKWGFSIGQAASLVNGCTQEHGKNGAETTSPEHQQYSFEKYLANGFQLGVVTNNYGVHDLLIKVLDNLACMKLGPNFSHSLHQDYFEMTRNYLGFVLENAKIITSYWQWFVHRRITPVEAGIVIHNKLSANESLPSWFLEFTGLLDRVSEKNDDYLSSYAAPQEVVGTVQNNDNSYTFLEPQYTLAVSSRIGYSSEPSYPHTLAVQVAAGITFMKFMLQTNVVLKEKTNTPELFPNKSLLQRPVGTPIIVEAESDGSTLRATNLMDDRTITDELNKFAINVAVSRCWAGAGTSSDVCEGLYLGEQIALRICSDLLASWYFDDHTYDKITPHHVTVPLFDGMGSVIPSSSYRQGK